MLDNKKFDFYFSEKEEAIMKVFWYATKPIGVGEVMTKLSDYKWATTATRNLVRKLDAKGAIEVVDIVKIGKTFGRLYKPTISADDYATLQFNKYYNKENETSNLIAALLVNVKKKPELSKSLKDLVDMYKAD